MMRRLLATPAAPEPPAAPAVPPTTPRPRPPQPVEVSLGAPAAEARVTDLEQWFGQRGLLIVGVLALLAAAGFFLKYAFDRGWVPPAVRSLLAIVAGVGVAAWGEQRIGRGMRDRRAPVVATARAGPVRRRRGGRRGASPVSRQPLRAARPGPRCGTEPAGARPRSASGRARRHLPVRRVGPADGKPADYGICAHRPRVRHPVERDGDGGLLDRSRACRAGRRPLGRAPGRAGGGARGCGPRLPVAVSRRGRDSPVGRAGVHRRLGPRPVRLPRVHGVRGALVAKYHGWTRLGGSGHGGAVGAVRSGGVHRGLHRAVAVLLEPGPARGRLLALGLLAVVLGRARPARVPAEPQGCALGRARGGGGRGPQDRALRPRQPGGAVPHCVLLRAGAHRAGGGVYLQQEIVARRRRGKPLTRAVTVSAA